MTTWLVSSTFVVLFSLVGSVVQAEETESPQGRSWLAEDINGKGVMDMLQTTLVFGDDDKVGGNAGCNRYFGSVKIDGDKIEFGPVGATRKMCPEAIMQQEDAYLGVLPEASRWRIKNRLLFIYSSDESLILRFSELEARSE